MSKLDFSFPVIRDIETTKARHESKMAKVADAPLFLDTYSDEDLFDEVYYSSPLRYRYWISDAGGQKVVRTIKHLVNRIFRDMIADYLADKNLPKSWDTAYYLVHQAEINKRMEAVSRLIYENVTD